jgi:N-methylhydantoinase B/oxoprolinase/acetone carboxylase alpha subunit
VAIASQQSADQRADVASDPIVLEIVRSALKTACEEMGRSMMRTAWSPIFNEGLDLSCMVFDGRGEMLAQGDFCPSHIGATVHIVEWAIKEVGAENMEPGDVILHNDPYRGGCHLPEFLTLKPIFVDGRIEAYAACIAHMVDVGGSVPGSFGDTRNIFEEGLRLPPVKIYRNDREVSDMFSVILANVRIPHYLYGDMKAMIGSLYTAERRVLELIERYGAPSFREIGEQIKDVSEVLAREVISALPDGEYTFEGEIEDDGVLPDQRWRIRATVVVRGDEVIVDYTGSSPQSAGPANQTWAVTASGTYAALFHLYPNELPRNAGAYRPITVIAPPGTFVNVDYPASCVGGNTDSMPTTIDVVLGALSEVAGQGTASDGDTYAIITLGGVDPRSGETFTLCYYDDSGGGARWIADGNDGEGCKNGNGRRMPVEVLESAYPIELLGYTLNRDPAGRPGAGRYRGGFGTRRWFRICAPEVFVSAHTNRNIVRPWGMAGGSEAGNCEVRFRRAGTEHWSTAVELFGTASPGKFSNVVLNEGDEILVGAPGGGGYGPPTERDPVAVADDVADGVYSIQEAREIFGVVLGDDGTVEAAKTSAAREMMQP